MEKVKNSAKRFFGKDIIPSEAKEKAEIVRQIRDTSVKLENAYCRFECEVNEDLLDSIIFEIQSLKALYRYLIKKAKMLGAECNEISVFGREGI